MGALGDKSREFPSTPRPRGTLPDRPVVPISITLSAPKQGGGWRDQQQKFPLFVLSPISHIFMATADFCQNLKK